MYSLQKNYKIRMHISFEGYIIAISTQWHINKRGRGQTFSDIFRKNLFLIRLNFLVNNNEKLKFIVSFKINCTVLSYKIFFIIIK